MDHRVLDVMGLGGSALTSSPRERERDSATLAGSSVSLSMSMLPDLALMLERAE